MSILPPDADIDLSACLPPGISLNSELELHVRASTRAFIHELNAVRFSLGGMLSIHCAAVMKDGSVSHPPCDNGPVIIGDLWEEDEIRIVVEYKRKGDGVDSRGTLTVHFLCGGT